MAPASKVKPTHKAVKSYYAALASYADQSVEHEGALRSAFQNLLSETGRNVGWTLIPELSLDANGHQIRPDGTFRAQASPRPALCSLRCRMPARPADAGRKGHGTRHIDRRIPFVTLSEFSQR